MESTIPVSWMLVGQGEQLRLVGAEDLQDLGLREPTLLHAVLLALGSPEDSHIRWTSFRGAGQNSPAVPLQGAASTRYISREGRNFVASDQGDASPPEARAAR